MPDSRPQATDLLEVVRRYLERDIAPLVPPHHQFQLKIAGRLLDTVGREIAQRPAADQAERLRLCALLGEDAQAAHDPAKLNRQLADAIRDGDLAVDDKALLAHLRGSLEDSLRINNPKWLAAPAAR